MAAAPFRARRARARAVDPLVATVDNWLRGTTMPPGKPARPLAVLVAALLGGAAAVTVNVATTATARAQEGASSVAGLTGGSSLVVRSRVARVDYRLARGAAGAAVPYTIVTYDVAEVLRGSLPGRSLALRYIGGPDGRGGFLEASEVPIFQVGDEDVLFVRGNGEDGCPLVACVGGRYRVLAGAVHDGRGSPVTGIVGGRIVARGPAPDAFGTVSYPAPSFDEVVADPQVQAALRRDGLSVEEARRRYEADAPARVELRTVTAPARTSDGVGAGGGARQQQSRGSAQPVGVDRFAAAIRAAAGSARTAAGTFRSVDANAAITPPSMAARGPGPRAGAERGPPSRTPADLAEERRAPAEDPAAVTRQKSR